eukprot:scaffold181278_cov31-Tisochrysis_lutea.AAC.1
MQHPGVASNAPMAPTPSSSSAWPERSSCVRLPGAWARAAQRRRQSRESSLREGITCSARLR